MNAYIDQYRDVYEVETLAKVLQVTPSVYWRHANGYAIHRGVASALGVMNI